MRTRRQLLHDLGTGLGSAALLSTLGRLGHLEAAALEPASDYRALVCLFLLGGNDANNTVVPYDEYASYQKVRGSSLNLAKDSLLKVSAPSQKAAFGLHPALAEVHSLYEKGAAAVVANVGTLAAPISKQEYLQGGARPDNLFSHADQQAQWQSAAVSPVDPAAQTGWGGRMADAVAPLNPTRFPLVISESGIPLFTEGVATRPLVPGTTLQGYGSGAASQARLAAFRRLLSLDLDKTLVAAASDVTFSALEDGNALNAALAKAPSLKTAFPTTAVGRQMQQIASIISVRSELKLSRQVFYVSLGSFDTHTGQTGTQQNLLGQASKALAALYDATVELGVAASVTSFTLSDFNRTFQPNSGGGSDHAWGSHQLVVGGAVKGGDFYGAFPTLALGGPDDTDTRGRWIPTTSVDEYGATLAQWLGVDAKALPAVFPNLGRFARTSLGFLS